MLAPARIWSIQGSWGPKTKALSSNRRFYHERIEIVASLPDDFNPCWLTHSYRTNVDMQSLRRTTRSIHHIIGPFQCIAPAVLQGLSVDIKLETLPNLPAQRVSPSFSCIYRLISCIYLTHWQTLRRRTSTSYKVPQDLDSYTRPQKTDPILTWVSLYGTGPDGCLRMCSASPLFPLLIILQARRCRQWGSCQGHGNSPQTCPLTYHLDPGLH